MSGSCWGFVKPLINKLHHSSRRFTMNSPGRGTPPTWPACMPPLPPPSRRSTAPKRKGTKKCLPWTSLWPRISARPWLSAGRPIKYQQSIKKLTLTARLSVRNITGRGWIFRQDNNPKQTSKSTQKWMGWTSVQRRSSESEGSGEILYEGMVSDLFSGVLQTKEKTQSCYLGKRTLR